MAFEVGQRVGDYEIVQLLGVGGMGHVYRVRNVISDRTEAMKVLLPDLTAERDLAIRFISEIRTLAQFDHPNIALLHTAFQSDNQLIMMMEFVEGSTLEQRAKQGPMTIEEVCGYVYQALSALSYAHGRGVVHRDIKPANLMLTSHGIVKLMDFGIAKSNVETNLTRPGTTIGSLYYMSPEQVRGDAVDGRSDLYSVGIMLYELLAGRRPFEADTTFSILNQQLNTPPQPPIELNPAMPRALNDVILHALAKSPDGRYQSADNFRDALRPFCPNQATTEPGHIAIAPAAAVMSSPTTAVAAGGAAAAIAAVEAASATGTVPAGSPSFAPPPFAPVAMPAPMAFSKSDAAPAGGYQQPEQAPPVAPGYQQFPPIYQPSQQTKSHKGLWIATGIAAAVLAMVGLAIGLPHWMGTHAAEAGDKAQASIQTTPQQPASQVADSSGSTGGPVTPPASDGSSGSPGGGTGMAVAPVTGGPATAAPRRSVAVGGMVGTGSPANARVEQPDAPIVRSGGSGAELSAEQDRFTDVSARAQAVDGSLNTLRQQQEASGYGLRGDMAAADNRMQSYLRAADQDLRSSNAAAAGKDITRAEQELATLEKFLGR